MESLSTRARSLATPRERLVAATVAVAAGISVLLIATDVFPYHSSNHDEGVYLQQAELLLDGQLRLYPGAVADSVRPWFFVEDGDSLYPKYQPLPAGLYAIGMAVLGEPRVVLGLIATTNTSLVYVLGSMAFDRRIGVLAAAAFGFAPMALVTSAVFLPYAPTTLFNLTFAVLYLRAYRTARPRTAALAGAAIGVAFFMRPFTAVLFALPFVGHAVFELLTTLHQRRTAGDIDGITAIFDATVIRRQGTTAVVGVVFVVLTLAYNGYITGDPFVFPYEAFAPLDGPGFGYRQILSHNLEYTPALALQSNGFVLRYLFTRWVFAGVAGSALMVVGLVASERGWGVPSGDTLAQRLLAGLLITVPAGNVFFWGNYNILSTMSDPTDGLIGQFGPFYHFDLLAPAAIFAAAGMVSLWRVLRSRLRESSLSPATTRAVTTCLVAISLLVVVGANAALLSEALDRNAAHTDTYEQAYEPFEQQEFENGVVFLPTPYGEWLNHPFQYLRNEPGFDGPVVYALDRGPPGNFAVLDAFPDRQLYRYDYRGEWTADPDERVVEPKLEPLSVATGERLDADTVVGIPQGVSHATVRIETADGHQNTQVRSLGDELQVEWSMDDGGVALDAVGGEPVDLRRLTLENSSAVVVQIRLSQEGAGTLTYRQEVAVRQTESGLQVIWPPERTVCPIVDDCGREGTYIPEDSREGVYFDVSVERS